MTQMGKAPKVITILRLVAPKGADGYGILKGHLGRAQGRRPPTLGAQCARCAPLGQALTSIYTLKYD